MATKRAIEVEVGDVMRVYGAKATAIRLGAVGGPYARITWEVEGREHKPTIDYSANTELDIWE